MPVAQASVAGTAPQRHITQAEWQRLENDPEFKQLIEEKKRFIVPATIFFIVYYFSLPILVGYFPDFMDTKVFGKINLAYLFALSQFAMTWILTYLYARRAKEFDVLAQHVADKARGALQ
jgi:uncharacterized membrane protein (DUF485 family)